MNSEVLAVVVCYNPNISALRVSLESVSKQVGGIALIDNASSNVAEIEALAIEFESSPLTFEVLGQTENLGLGAAHNIGFDYAQVKNFTHVLLLDQDSVPLDGMVDSLLQALNDKSEANLVSAVGPKYINADNGSESFFVRFGGLKFNRLSCASRDSEGCVEADFLISSGSLFSLDSIEKIGNMDESLFIDHVDTEWFLRARSKGFQAFGVCDAIMQHGLGEQTHRLNLGGVRSWGRRRNVPQHKPFRYYYIFRNSFNLYGRSYASLMWKWNDLQRLALIFIMFGFWKSPRRANLAMMFKGMWDGLRGTKGSVNLS